MFSDSHRSGHFDEAEYVINVEDSTKCPQLWRLINHGYRFTVLQRAREAFKTFTLASHLIRSNGKGLLQRFHVLTPEFNSLCELERYIQDNLLDILGCQHRSPA